MDILNDCKNLHQHIVAVPHRRSLCLDIFDMAAIDLCAAELRKYECTTYSESTQSTSSRQSLSNRYVPGRVRRQCASTRRSQCGRYAYKHQHSERISPTVRRTYSSCDKRVAHETNSSMMSDRRHFATPVAVLIMSVFSKTAIRAHFENHSRACTGHAQ
jgi:hypothetical protein